MSIHTQVKSASFGKLELALLDNGQMVFAGDAIEALELLIELPADIRDPLFLLLAHDKRNPSERFADIEELAKDPRLKALEES